MPFAAAVAPPDHPLFTGDGVHEIRIRFHQPDWWERLTENYRNSGADANYLEASFEWKDVRFERIGVRFKGHGSYSEKHKKRPLRLKLNEYVKGQKIGRTGSLSLSNFWNDPSMVREKMYYELAAGAGLAAPRAGYAALYINGTYWGLYSLVEVVNDDFLKSRFPGDHKGSLYKGDPSGSLEYLGDDERSYAGLYEKKTRTDESWADLMRLIKTLSRTPDHEFAASVSPLLDVDAALTALALDNITVNLDNYVGTIHNYYLYVRPSDGRAQFIPWDPSLAFGALAQQMSVEERQKLPLEWMRRGSHGNGDARPLASRLWKNPAYLARYRAILKRLNEQVARPEAMIARMEHLRQMIAPWVNRDPNKLATTDEFNRAMIRDTPGGDGPVPAISAFVRARNLAVRAKLAGGSRN